MIYGSVGLVGLVGPTWRDVPSFTVGKPRTGLNLSDMTYSHRGRIHGQCAFEPKVRRSRRVGSCCAKADAMLQATRAGQGQPTSEGLWDKSESGTKPQRTSFAGEG